MTGPEERAGDAHPASRDVVWSAGEPRARPRPWRAARSWLVLVVLAGAASFVLAYALHVVTAALPAGPAAAAPMWVPEGRPDPCRSSGHGADG